MAIELRAKNTRNLRQAWHPLSLNPLNLPIAKEISAKYHAFRVAREIVSQGRFSVETADHARLSNTSGTSASKLFNLGITQIKTDGQGLGLISFIFSLARDTFFIPDRLFTPTLVNGSLQTRQTVKSIWMVRQTAFLRMVARHFETDTPGERALITSSADGTVLASCESTSGRVTLAELPRLDEWQDCGVIDANGYPIPASSLGITTNPDRSQDHTSDAYVAIQSASMFSNSMATRTFGFTPRKLDGFSEVYAAASLVSEINGSRISHPYYGELSLFTEPIPLLGRGEKIGDVLLEVPDIIMKDETLPRTWVHIAAGGSMADIDFGTRTLGEMVHDNCLYLLGSVDKDVRSTYMILSGTCDHVIKPLGDPFVGQLDLATFTGQKAAEAPFIFVGQFVTAETPDDLVAPRILVNRKTGVVKYYLPAASLKAQREKLAYVNFAAKRDFHVTGAEVAAGLEAQPFHTTGENTALAVHKDMIKQTDVAPHGQDEQADYELMEITTKYIVSKELMIRLKDELQKLSKRHRTLTGQTVELLLEEYGGAFGFAEMVFMSMTGSDPGGYEEFLAGFVNKFPALTDKIPPAYLNNVYHTIRNEVFKGKKMYAANLGRGAELIYLRDRQLSPTAFESGDANFEKICLNLITWSFAGHENWQYWREFMDLPTGWGTVHDNVYSGAYRWHRPSTWLSSWRRDQVASYTVLPEQVNLRGSYYLHAFAPIMSDAGSETIDVYRTTIGIGSTPRWDKDYRSSRGNEPTTYYFFGDEASPTVGNASIVRGRPGIYLTYDQTFPLKTSGEGQKGVRGHVEIPRKTGSLDPITLSSDVLATRSQKTKALLDGLHSNPTQRRHTDILAGIAQALNRLQGSGTGRYTDGGNQNG